jgi:hypothetical protein
LELADVVLAKLDAEAEAGMERMGFTKVESRKENYAKLSDQMDKWRAEDEAELAGKIAQAELAAYVAACKAMCGGCRTNASRIPDDSPAWGATEWARDQILHCCNALPVRACIADWHKRNDPLKPCGHPPIKQAALDERFTSDVYCECGARRKRGWLCDWENPVDEPRKAATV